jgi:hypothetical protein
LFENLSSKSEIFVSSCSVCVIFFNHTNIIVIIFCNKLVMCRSFSSRENKMGLRENSQFFPDADLGIFGNLFFSDNFWVHSWQNCYEPNIPYVIFLQDTFIVCHQMVNFSSHLTIFFSKWEILSYYMWTQVDNNLQIVNWPWVVLLLNWCSMFWNCTQ